MDQTWQEQETQPDWVYQARTIHSVRHWLHSLPQSQQRDLIKLWMHLMPEDQLADKCKVSPPEVLWRLLDRQLTNKLSVEYRYTTQPTVNIAI